MKGKHWCHVLDSRYTYGAIRTMIKSMPKQDDMDEDIVKIYESTRDIENSSQKEAQN